MFYESYSLHALTLDTNDMYKVCFVFLFFFFSTGLVRLYIAGLPLRSCHTIGATSVQGSAQCLFFRFWQLQDLNPRPAVYHADVLPLRHFDSSNSFFRSMVYVVILHYLSYSLVSLGFHCLFLSFLLIPIRA